MTATSYLLGGGANIKTFTPRQGNEIGGFFRLQFQGFLSEPIAADASASSLQDALLSIPIVTSAGLISLIIIAWM